MRKIYKKPLTEWMVVESQSLLQASAKETTTEDITVSPWAQDDQSDGYNEE